MPTPQLLESGAFAALFRTFRSTAFRLQTRDHYEVPTDRSELDRYLAGKPVPSDQWLNAPWFDQMRTSIGQGKQWANVHVITGPLTPYLRFGMEWAYPLIADAGGEVRVLQDVEPRRLLPGAILEDFWLFDDASAVRMHYDATGSFVGASDVAASELRAFRATRDAVMADALPLEKYLAQTRALPLMIPSGAQTLPR